MSSSRQQYVVEAKETESRNRQVLRQCQVFHEGKSVMLVQVCFRCNRKFPFKQGRNHCPRCNDILRNQTLIIKTP